MLSTAVVYAAIANASVYEEWARIKEWQEENIARGEIVSRIDHGAYVDIRYRVPRSDGGYNEGMSRLHPYNENHLQITATNAAGGALFGGLCGLIFWNAGGFVRGRFRLDSGSAA